MNLDQNPSAVSGTFVAHLVERYLMTCAVRELRYIPSGCILNCKTMCPAKTQIRLHIFAVADPVFPGHTKQWLQWFICTPVIEELLHDICGNHLSMAYQIFCLISDTNVWMVKNQSGFIKLSKIKFSIET